jgi:hypothetical protein
VHDIHVVDELFRGVIAFLAGCLWPPAASVSRHLVLSAAPGKTLATGRQNLIEETENSAWIEVFDGYCHSKSTRFPIENHEAHVLLNGSE